MFYGRWLNLPLLHMAGLDLMDANVKADKQLEGYMSKRHFYEVTQMLLIYSSIEGVPEKNARDTWLICNHSPQNEDVANVPQKLLFTSQHKICINGCSVCGGNERDEHRACHVNHYKYWPLEGSPSGAKAQRQTGQ